MSRFGEFLGTRKVEAPAPAAPAAPEPVAVPSEPAESVAKPVSFEEMNKEELEAYGREHGVELDRRRSRKRLIEELKEINE